MGHNEGLNTLTGKLAISQTLTRFPIETAPRDGTWVLASFWDSYAVLDSYVYDETGIGTPSEITEFLAWNTFRWVGDVWESADNENYWNDDRLVSWMPLPTEE